MNADQLLGLALVVLFILFLGMVLGTLFRDWRRRVKWTRKGRHRH